MNLFSPGGKGPGILGGPAGPGGPRDPGNPGGPGIPCGLEGHVVRGLGPPGGPGGPGLPRDPGGPGGPGLPRGPGVPFAPGGSGVLDPGLPDCPVPGPSFKTEISNFAFSCKVGSPKMCEY